MEPIKISTLQKHIHDFVLRNQQEYNPDFNDELNEAEVKKLTDAFGVKNITELQNAGLDTFTYESTQNNTNANIPTANEVVEEDEFNKIAEEGNEEISGQTKKIFDVRKYGSGSERLYTLMNAGELMADGSALGGIAAMNNGFDAEEAYYMNSESVFDEETIDKLIEIDAKREDLRDLAKEYLRQNQSAIMENLKNGKSEEITLPNGKKMLFTPSYKIKTNNNSQDSVKEYKDENSDDSQDESKGKSEDINKLITGFVVAVETATDNWQVLGKLDFGYQDDTDLSLFGNYQNTTKGGFDYNISGAAGMTTSKDNTEIRYGATFDIVKSDFAADATLYGTSERSIYGDKNWNLNITGEAGYKNAKLGGFYEADEYTKTWGATAGYHGEVQKSNGLTFGGKIKAEAGNLSYKEDVIGSSTSSLINIAALGSAYVNFKAEDLSLRSGIMCRGKWDYNPSEEKDKWSNSFITSVYGNLKKGRYSVAANVNFIRKEAIPSVQATVDDVILPGLGITAGYTGPTNYEKQIGSKGTFIVGLKKGLGL